MATEIEALHEQLFAAQSERDECVRKFQQLQHELSASSALIKDLEAKFRTADAEIQRQARQLTDQAAASDAAAAAAASARARFLNELQASQNQLSGSQQALQHAKSELEHEKQAAASLLAAAAIESKELLKQMRALETRLFETEHQKSLLEKSQKLQHTEVRQEQHGISRPTQGGHAIGSVIVGLPQHHHHQASSHHADVNVEVPPKRRNSEPPVCSSPEAAGTIDVPLTPSISALLSSAHLPAREAGLTRSRSSSRAGAETCVTQVQFDAICACCFLPIGQQSLRVLDFPKTSS
jgi:hypothetical protein